MGKQAVNIYQDLVRKLRQIFKSHQPVVGPVLALNAEAGEVAGKLYKNLRDRGAYLPNVESEVAIMKELGDCLFYITATAQDLGYELEDVIDMNYEKVQLRLETGTTSGDGDDREVQS